MTEGKVKKLDLLIKTWVGDKVDILEYNLIPLVAKGENYGSEILCLEVKVRYDNNPTIVTSLTAVTKLCPPNDYLKEIFNTSITFKKEISAYNIIFPILTQFQKDQGCVEVIDILPKCYASRLNLNNSELVDDDAVILLENLKKNGFQTVDRMRGFDLEQTVSLIKTLAVFHAVPVALRMLKPEVFHKNVLPHLCRNTVFDSVAEEEENLDVNAVIQIAQKSDKCKPFVRDIDHAMRANLRNLQSSFIMDHVFTSLNHNDLWVNNIMVTVKDNSTVIKLIDFQLMDYGSCVNDLLFFLFTSVQWDVIESNFDYLVNAYYQYFINTLKSMKCNTESFSFNVLLEEIEFCAKFRQFFHIMVMLRHVFGTKDKTKDLSEIKMEDFSTEDSVSVEYKERVLSVILFFIKRNWIDKV